MAISELSAILKLEMGDFKSSISSAKTSMDDMSKTVKNSMESVSNETGKSQGIFSKAFGKMASDGEKFKNKQSSLTSTIAKTALGFVGVTSAASLFNKAIGRVDKIKSAEKAIKLMTGSQKDATTVMDGLQKVVDGTPLSIDAFTASAKGMIATGMEAGKVEKVMKAVGDSAYAVGDGAESIEVLGRAFKSLQASGTASLGDLNRMFDQGVPVYRMLGNEFGVTEDAAKKMVSDGLIPSADAMDIITKAIENGSDGVAGNVAKMGGSMKVAGETVAGASANIATALVKTLAVPIDNAYEKIVVGLTAVKDGIKTFQPFLIAVFTGISQVVEGVILGLVDTFNLVKPVISAVTSVLKGLVDQVKKFLPEGTSLTDVARKLTPIIIGLFAAFQAYKHITMAASTLRLMGKAMKGSSTAMGALGKVSKLLVKGFGLITAHPIVAVFIALGAALVFAYNKSETFRKAVDSILKPLKDLKFIDAFGKGISGIGKAFSGIKFDGVSKGFSGISDSIKKVDFSKGLSQVVDGIGGITSAINKNAPKVGQSMGQLLGGVLKAIGAALPGIIAGGLAIITGLIKGISQGIGSLIAAIGELVVTILLALTEAVPQMVIAGVQLMVAFISAITSQLPLIITTGTEMLMTLIQGIVGAIPKIVPTVITAITTFIDAIAAGLPQIIASGANLLVSFLKGITDNLPKVATAVTSLVTTFLTALANNLPSIISSGVDVVVSLLKGIADNLPRMVKAAVDVIVAFLKGISDNLGRIISAGLDVILAFVKGIGDNAQKVVNEVFNTLNKVAFAVGTTPGKMVEVGKSLIRGIVSGFKGAAGGLVTEVTKLIDKVKGFFSNMKLKLPKIGLPELPRLPRISISGEFSLKNRTVPSISWFAKGGIATGASVVGVGEAGDEAIVPLSNKGRMKPFAQAVSSYMNSDGSGNNSGTRYPEKISLEVPLIISGRKLATVMLDDLMDLIDKKQGRKFRKAGDK